jgi:hypothetical protein
VKGSLLQCDAVPCSCDGASVSPQLLKKRVQDPDSVAGLGSASLRRVQDPDNAR